MDQDFAERFVADWIDSWNAHDLDKILSHCTDDIEMSSPVIIQLAGEPSGTLCGKAAVGAYWKNALALIPNLHFECLCALTGVSSITIYYKVALGRLAAEVFHFGSDGKVIRAFAHYSI